MADLLPFDDTTRVRRKANRQVGERSMLHAILDAALVAHVGVVREGLPVVLPFACARDGETLLLHGSTGSGLLASAAGVPVCVTVTHLDALVFARTAFDSSMRYRSAVVHGTAVEVPPEERDAALVLLTDHLFPGRSAEIRSSSTKELAATLVLRVGLGSASVKVAAGPLAADPDDREPRDVWAGLLPLGLAAGDPVPGPDVPDGVPVPPSVRRAADRLRGSSDGQ